MNDNNPNTEGASVPTPCGARPLSNWAQICSGLCAALALIGACIGVYFAYSQVQTAIQTYEHAIQREKRQAAEDSVAKLYAMDNEIERWYTSTDFYTRDVFRDDDSGKHYKELLAKNDNKSKMVFERACALNGNMFEYYLLVRDNLRSHPQGKEITDAWDYYLKRTCEKSYGFRTYIYLDRDVWTTTLVSEVDRYSKGHAYDKKNEKK